MAVLYVFTHSWVKTQSWGDYRSSSLEIPHPSPLLSLQHRGIRCLCALQSLAPPLPNSLPQSLLGNTPKAEQIVYLPPHSTTCCSSQAHLLSLAPKANPPLSRPWSHTEASHLQIPDSLRLAPPL